jgi:multiple sugar transport system substrate-binding protein
MSKFKIILTAVFAICFVAGLILFAMYRAGSGQATANLTVWGTISTDAFNATYKDSSVAKNKNIIVTYVKKNPASFDTDFVEALADGAGPDVIIVPDSSLYKNRNRIFTIPYASYPERTFKDQFISGSDIFLKSDGIIALPLAIDPMVMYWNRDMFSNSFIPSPPKYWDEVYNLVNTMTKKDSAGNVMKSALAFGEWSNVTNAKEIVSMLFLQAGTPIVIYKDQKYSSAINSQSTVSSITPGQAALDFYTQFSNPTSASYSWNRSLPSSLNFFLSGNLAMYFGFSSEIFNIQQKNPNLNFDVTYIPQDRHATTKIGFGRMYAMSIVKQSKNIASAFSLIVALTEPASQTALEKMTNLPPIRNDLLASKPTDAFRVVFYNSALISRFWVDPDPEATTNTFRDMIQSVTSGQARVSEALSNADQDLNSLLLK